MNVRTEQKDGSTFVVAEGPSPLDISRAIHERLVEGLGKNVDMEVARQLVLLGWTPPAGHPAEVFQTECTASLIVQADGSLRCPRCGKHITK